MGLCFSCRKSKDRFKVKGSKICSHIHSAVSPIHISQYEAASSDHSNCCTIISHAVDTTCQKGGPSAAAPKPSEAVPFRRSKAPSSSPPPPQEESRMATSFPNMNLTNPIKGLVSKNRNRYQKNGFDLDLTYITPKIIAMGYPASNLEGVYRNRIDDVVKFLDSEHKDHYYIYNLCSERSYDKAKFHQRVHVFPFDDHNPPNIQAIQPFCTSVQEWLTRDERNVVAVHCKAGKGRTGTMICCYLLHSGLSATAEHALQYYGEKRTQDHKGVTIPSQMRYVQYYEHLKRHNFNYAPVLMFIKELIVQPVTSFAGTSISFTISQQTLSGHQKCKKLRQNDMYEVKKGSQSPFTIKLDYCLPLSGDIKMEFYRVKLGMKEKLFRFWFNTYFVTDKSQDDLNSSTRSMGNHCRNGSIFVDDDGAGGCVDTTTSGAEETFILALDKRDLDLNHKKVKLCDKDGYFKLKLILQKVPNEHSCPLTYVRTPSIEQGTPTDSSDSSDDFTNEEDDWDSGESTYL